MSPTSPPGTCYAGDGRPPDRPECSPGGPAPASRPTDWPSMRPVASSWSRCRWGCGPGPPRRHSRNHTTRRCCIERSHVILTGNLAMHAGPSSSLRAPAWRIMEFRDGEVVRERIHFGESSERRPGGHNGSSGWILRPASVCVTCSRLSEPRWPPISVSGRSVDRSARRTQLRRTHAGRRGHV